ncbi:hypothetical protein MKX03_026058 [Papaver bracteatum]|nr:hypothetical protein MKX03_026058 [Papaver bracteatum]
MTEVADASISVMKVWTGPGCKHGKHEKYSTCGCSTIQEHGAYEFVYQGQYIFFFNEKACGGLVHTQLQSTTIDCRPFGWKSLWIQC